MDHKLTQLIITLMMHTKTIKHKQIYTREVTPNLHTEKDILKWMLHSRPNTGEQWNAVNNTCHSRREETPVKCIHISLFAGVDNTWLQKSALHYRRTYFGGPSVSLCKDINRSTIPFINIKLSSMKWSKSLIKYFSSNNWFSDIFSSFSNKAFVFACHELKGDSIFNI